MLRYLVAAASLLLAFQADALAQDVTFARDDYASFAGARAIVSADFNRDGLPDVALANSGRNSVTVLLNHRDAGLARAADVAVGAGPFAMTTGDFNRDGIPDLAVANADGNSISVLLGRGDASFTRNDIAAASQNPRGITAADVNHDGKLDLIYSAYATGAVQVLIGNGAGAFTKGVAYVSPALHPQGLATADFNHDGHLDIAVAYASATGLRILYGNGGTAFTARTVAGEANLNVLEVGDFNGDSWMDVAAASTTSSTVAIYRGGAAGVVYTQTSVVGSSPRGIAVGDVNDDGMLDIVTANRGSSTLSMLLGDRGHAGTFLAHVEVAAGAGSRDAVLADFDVNGRLDIASANEYAASATVLSNHTFFAPAGFAFRHVALTGAPWSHSTPRGAWPADFNRDGRPDLVTGTGDVDTLTVLLTGGPAISLPLPGYLDALRVADVNGDGNPDVVYSAGGSPAVIGVYLGDGRGGFVNALTDSGIRVRFFAVGDLNRDGRPDIVCLGPDTAYNPMLQVRLGRGDGTFAAPITSVPLPDSPLGIVLADVNRDGRLDAVTMLSGRYARVWFGNGDGGLTVANASWTTSYPSTVIAQFDIADVNHDGYVDIVAPEWGQMAVAFGGPAGFAAPVYTPVNFGGFLITASIGDLNGDGHPDVALGSGDIMFGNGDGTFVSGGLFDFGGAPFLSVADFTRDGLPDIIAASWATGTVVLANTRDTENQAPIVDGGPDLTLPFNETEAEFCNAKRMAVASDPDGHALTYEWRRDDVVISDNPGVAFCGLQRGSYVFTAIARDGRGGVGTDTVAVTVVGIKEIVLWAGFAAVPDGRWTLVSDETSPGLLRVYDPNLGAPKVAAPLAAPTSTVTFNFAADPTEIYKLWIRLKADANSWANDSVWVQFSGATDLAGTPKYRTGTNSGLSVSLEECSGCGVSGWGWEDDGWGAPNTNGVLLRFPPSSDRSPQTIVIQTREDGVSIDQIVLSAEKYLTARPGAAKNDATLLRSTQPPW